MLKIIARLLESDNLAPLAEPDLPAGAAPGLFTLIAVAIRAGMDALTAKSAFEPCYATEPVGRATGLGLSQLYGFDKQSNGNVEAVTKAGSGSPAGALI